MLKKAIFFIAATALVLLLAPFPTLHAAYDTAVYPQKSTAANVEWLAGDVSESLGMYINDVTQVETVACQFSLAGDALEVGVQCPSYADASGSLTIQLYSFVQDYETTLAGTPAASHTFTDFPDNSLLALTFDASAPLKKGEYILRISEPLDQVGYGVGVWLSTAHEAQYFYCNDVRNPANALRLYVGYASSDTHGYEKPTAPDRKESDLSPNTNVMLRFSDPDAKYYYLADKGTQCTLTEDGYLSIAVSGEESAPAVRLSLLFQNELDGEAYPYLLIRAKFSEAVWSKGSMTFSTAEYAKAPLGQTMLYANTADWQNIIVPFGGNMFHQDSINEYLWTIGTEASGSPVTVTVEYVLFFKSLDAANAWDGKIDELTTPVPEVTATADITPSPTASPGSTPVSTPAGSGEPGGNWLVFVWAGIGAAILVTAVILLVVRKKTRSGKV